MVTGASALPQVGSSADTGMSADEWSAVPPVEADFSAEMSTPPLLAMPHMRNMPARNDMKKPTIAVPLFMIVSPFSIRLRWMLRRAKPKVVGSVCWARGAQKLRQRLLPRIEPSHGEAREPQTFR